MASELQAMSQLPNQFLAHGPPMDHSSLQQRTRGDMPIKTSTEDHEGLCRHDHEHEGSRSRHHLGSAEADKRAEDKDANISISATSKQAEQAVAPFLAKHIPKQYNPLGGGHSLPQTSNNSNTKYCYRHRPDLKCRRQANEPSMEQLQNELGTLSQSDQQGIAHVWSLFSAAPPKHRKLMLQGILTQCCFPQLSFVQESVRDLIKIDFIQALPTEIGFKILGYLDSKSLCNAAMVSQRWRTLADDDVVWHKMCEQHIDRKCTKCGWGLPLLEKTRLRTEKRQMQLRATGRAIHDLPPVTVPTPDGYVEVESQSSRESSVAPANTLASAGQKRKIATGLPSPEASIKRACSQSLRQDQVESYFQPRVRPWKNVYKDRYKVSTNWKHGRWTTKVFKGHTNGVMCLQFDDNILATGSYDSTIKIWDIETGTELRTLVGHTSGIRCLQFNDQTLMSGSLDGTIRVWNWRTGQCIRVVPHHNGGVISLHFEGSFVASGSMDKTIRIYNSLSKGTFLLQGHTDWVNAVKVDAASRTVFSASDDCTVRLWDLDTKQCIRVFEGHVGQVQQVLPLPAEFDLDEADLVAGEKEDDASSTTSSTHDHPSFHLALDAEDDVTKSFGESYRAADAKRSSPPRYMLTGALDSTIRLWHVPSGRCLRTFFGHVFRRLSPEQDEDANLNELFQGDELATRSEAYTAPKRHHPPFTRPLEADDGPILLPKETLHQLNLQSPVDLFREALLSISALGNQKNMRLKVLRSLSNPLPPYNVGPKYREPPECTISQKTIRRVMREQLDKCEHPREILRVMATAMQKKETSEQFSHCDQAIMSALYRARMNVEDRNILATINTIVTRLHKAGLQADAELLNMGLKFAARARSLTGMKRYLKEFRERNLPLGRTVFRTVVAKFSIGHRGLGEIRNGRWKREELLQVLLGFPDDADKPPEQRHHLGTFLVRNDWSHLHGWVAVLARCRAADEVWREWELWKTSSARQRDRRTHSTTKAYYTATQRSEHWFVEQMCNAGDIRRGWQLLVETGLEFQHLKPSLKMALVEYPEYASVSKEEMRPALEKRYVVELQRIEQALGVSWVPGRDGGDGYHTIVGSIGPALEALSQSDFKPSPDYGYPTEHEDSPGARREDEYDLEEVD